MISKVLKKIFIYKYINLYLYLFRYNIELKKPHLQKSMAYNSNKLQFIRIFGLVTTSEIVLNN